MRIAIIRAVAIAIVALAAVAVTLSVIGTTRTGETVTMVAVAALNAAAGLLIVRSRPRSLVGLVLMLNALLVTLAAAAAPYAAYALFTNPGVLPGGRLAAVWADGSWPTLFAGVAAIAFVFPDDRLPSPRWRPWLVAGGAAYAVATASLLFSHSRLSTPFRDVANPLPKLPGVAQWALLPFWGAAFATLIAAAWAVRTKVSRATGRERLQLLWLAQASLTIPAAVIVCLLDTALAGHATFVTGAALIATLVSIPVAVGIAILRHRLFDIELIVSRTVVYGTLTASIVLVYVAAVFALDRPLHGHGIPGLIAAALIAAGFQPLRVRLQRRADRWVYGDRSDPYVALVRLADRLHAAVAPAEAMQSIVDSVADALRLAYVAIEIADPVPSVVAERGQPTTGETVELALTHHGELVGTLICATQRGAALSLDDRRLLEHLAKQAGPAVHAARLTIDLRLSRERLVTAREEERRRLRRDLHDGLGSSLAAAVLKVNAAERKLVPGNPEAASPLAEIRSDIQEAIADIRVLVHALRPPVLDQLGLVPAVREYANRFNSDLFSVTVEAPTTIGGLSAAAEVAAFRIATEAITNTARHAGARRCRVHLFVNGGLRIRIDDDGQGINAPPGIGLSSMRERAEELGGAFSIRSGDPRGTVVEALIPLVST